MGEAYWPRAPGGSADSRYRRGPICCRQKKRGHCVATGGCVIVFCCPGESCRPLPSSRLPGGLMSEIRDRLVHATTLLLAVSAPVSLTAQVHDHPAGDPTKVGSVTFEVSCADEVASDFALGVAMLHSFWF